MPDIKLPYNKAGITLADTLEKEVEAMGGDVSYDYPSDDAPGRVENYQWGGLVENILNPIMPTDNLNPIMPTDLQMNTKFEPPFEDGGKVDETLQATGKFQDGGKISPTLQATGKFGKGGNAMNKAMTENIMGQIEGKVYKK